MKLDAAFYQFATAIVAMICIVIVSVWGNGSNEYVISALSSVMGAGAWGGVLSKMHQEKGGMKRPARGGP